MSLQSQEKTSDAYAPPGSAEQALILERDWTQHEEARAKRKLDIIIMSCMSLGFFCLQLDRGNISNALTDNFLRDLRINQDQFNIGQQLLSVGIVLFEIPSNMLLYRVGPGIWIPLQLFLFGTVATFQAWQNNYASFLSTRLLLGITESGFIPGGLWTLSTWYTRRETAKRVTLFYYGNMLGLAFSKLLAYGILQMRGVGGLAGWQWLFILMGVFTLLSGIVLGLLLPDSFRKPHSMLLPKICLFSERELHILKTRVLIDDPMKGKKKKSIGKSAFRKAFSTWQIWIHVIISMCNNGPQRAFETYSPSIVSSFGFDPLASNALASVGLFIQLPVSFAFAFVSDHFDLRGPTTMAALSCHMLGYIFNRGFTETNIRGLRYFGVVFTQSFGTFPHPLNISYLSTFCRDSEERALAMAMVIMGANCAGIYGAQIFRADDSPRYRRGFVIGIAILAFGVALVGIRYFFERRDKKRNAKQTASIESRESQDVESGARTPEEGPYPVKA